MAAYVEHAHNLGYESPEIFAFMQHALSELTRNDITMEELVQRIASDFYPEDVYYKIVEENVVAWTLHGEDIIV